MNFMRNMLQAFREIEAVTVLTGAVLLCFAAGYNMYPLVYPDTGTYIVTGLESRVPADRPLLYGLFLRHTSMRATMWFALFAQALLVSSVIFGFVKTYFKQYRYHLIYLGLLIPLISCTALSIKTSTLIPDVFTPLPILCFFILLHGTDNKVLRWWYIAITIFCIGTHQSHLLMLGIALGLYGMMLLIRKQFRPVMLQWRKASFMVPVCVIGFFITPIINTIYSGKFFWSKSSGIFFMGRFADNGLLQTYLKENCHCENLELCQYQGKIPVDFLWDSSSPLYKMGGWENPPAEYDLIVRKMLTTPRYLGMFLYKSVAASFSQFFSFQISVRAENAPMSFDSPPYHALKTVYHHESGTYVFSNQNTGRLDYTAIDARQTWFITILLGAFVLLLVAGYKEDIRSFLPVITMILMYTIANAIVCGTLSIPNPRYQTRVFWLIPLVLMMAMLRSWLKRRSDVPSRTGL
jgi:hypothetical protein